MDRYLLKYLLNETSRRESELLEHRKAVKAKRGDEEWKWTQRDLKCVRALRRVAQNFLDIL